MATVIEQATPEINVEVNQGADFDLQIAYTEADETTVVPLTGYTARMQVRAAYGAATALVSLTSDPGDGLSIDPDAGVVDIHLSAEQTAGLPARTCVWDLEIVDPAGHVQRLAQGEMPVSPEVTR